MSASGFLDRFFEITERGSTLKTEVKGGILVFLAMSYIIVVNPGMMVASGIPYDQAFTATIIMAIIGSVLMGLYAKFPVAMAPGMGINAMFCFTAVGMLGSWQSALVAVIVSGAIFFVITVTGVRQRVLDRIPHGIKSGIIAGIGCFIAFIGLQNAGIIANSDSTLVALGDLSDPTVLLGVFCLLLTVFLVARRISAGVLIAMIATAVIGMVAGIIEIPSSIFSVPAAPPLGAFIDGLDASSIFSVEFVVIVIAFSFVEFFDGSGTLMAVGKRAGFTDENDNVTCDTALNVDAAIASLSGVVGCTPTTAFAESAVGIEAGARTGLAPIVVAILFGLALFVAPLFGVIGYCCTVGAMVVVGAAMIAELKGTDWDDMPTCVTILFTILMMLLTYSITDGIAFGIIGYCVTMLGAGRGREVHPVLYALAVIFAVYLLICAFSLG